LCDEVIRNKQLISCFSIDNVIEQVVSRIATKAGEVSKPESFIKEKWDGQALMHKRWSESKR
jgi:hypothetical protein